MFYILYTGNKLSSNHYLKAIWFQAFGHTWVHDQTVSCCSSKWSHYSVGKSSLLDMNRLRVQNEGPLRGIHLTSLWLSHSPFLCHAHLSLCLCCPFWRRFPPLKCFCWCISFHLNCPCEASSWRNIQDFYRPSPSLPFVCSVCLCLCYVWVKHIM